MLSSSGAVGLEIVQAGAEPGEDRADAKRRRLEEPAEAHRPQDERDRLMPQCYYELTIKVWTNDK